MIVVKLTGGMGNQMFQYAFGKYLAERYSTGLKLDISYYKDFELRKFALNSFALEKVFISKEECDDYFNPSSLLGRIRKKLGQHRVVIEKQFGFSQAAVNECTANTLISGYWQSEKYFAGISDQIRENFSFTHIADPVSRKLMNQIETKNSVSIHVRRGDFVTDHKTSQVHGTCDVSYFQKAISFMVDSVETPVFYIFSDDMKWAMEKLQFKQEHHFVDHDRKDEEDMWLMSRCKHNIIANSSFSWWAAWLNSNKYKKIIAPTKWFNDGKSVQDLIPQSWVRL